MSFLYLTLLFGPLLVLVVLWVVSMWNRVHPNLLSHNTVGFVVLVAVIIMTLSLAVYFMNEHSAALFIAYMQLFILVYATAVLGQIVTEVKERNAPIKKRSRDTDATQHIETEEEMRARQQRV